MGNKHQKPKNVTASKPHSQLTVHPINKLKLVEVPAQATEGFKRMAGCVMHFFENVTQCCQRKWQKKRRVLILTDQAFYCCLKEGILSRCARVTDVKEIFVGEEGELGLKFNDNFDMLFEMPADKQQEVAFIIQSIQRVGELPVAVVTKYTSSVPREKLNLKEPPKLTVETALERMRDKAPQPAQSPSG
eukprot:TRINITY_DN2517_c0_g1_i2.p1 TRINITY_DN2517_c0_g1~~TRINITY_DN2517_c0_g1_i2.p1  ORF type:complete len:189 (+),score=19.16 TRINITY_DN2517_c0_g1_i2:45-611(+)